jgi:hypothetical protein
MRRNSSGRTTRHLAPLVASVLLTLFLPAVSRAQQGGDPGGSPAPADGQSLLSKRYGVSVRRPEGWTVVPATDGVLVALAPKGDPDGVRIELRISPNVPEQHRKVYLQAFAEGLSGAYRVVEAPVVQVHGAREGHELVMAAKNPSDNEQRLVAFFFFRRDVAYTLVASLTKSRWSEIYEVFGDVVQSIAFEETNE